MAEPTPGFDPERPHRRRNALTGEWVLVSPHRTRRPWQGRTESRPDEDRGPAYLPGCYLCPGNERAGGARNPDFDDVFVFDNDFAALVEAPRDTGDRRPAAGDLLRAEPETGICRVVCFSPRHDLTLAEMEVDGIRRVVDVWAAQYAELGARADVAWVQIFENKGELMGCSNPHPHGQIWAQRSIPREPAKEDERQRAHFAEHGRSLLADYLAAEVESGERIVLENDGFVALVPFWAVWPFETLVISREHRRTLVDLSDRERDDLADILKRLTTRYDNLFEVPFPYSAGIHQAPTSGLVARTPTPESGRRTHEAGWRTHEAGWPATAAHWHFHMHFYPPLLRSATVRKFMVGYEMLGEPQRDITAESAAARLRSLPRTHYRQRAREGGHA